MTATQARAKRRWTRGLSGAWSRLTCTQGAATAVGTVFALPVLVITPLFEALLAAHERGVCGQVRVRAAVFAAARDKEVRLFRLHAARCFGNDPDAGVTLVFL